VIGGAYAADFATYNEIVRARPRPIYVPDLSRPAGIDIDANGQVACVHCGKRIDVGTADIVGKGYRCATCSALATPEDDADASLTPSEQAHVPDVASRRSLVMAGCAFTVLDVILWFTKLDIPLPRGDLFYWVMVGAVGCFALALANQRKWR
jgi:DNA-directed RNA polymerase subunit RPC12/RpoP